MASIRAPVPADTGVPPRRPVPEHTCRGIVRPGSSGICAGAFASGAAGTQPLPGPVRRRRGTGLGGPERPVADEPCCTPGSVSGGPRGPPGGGHPSGTGVATGLVRSTRGLGRAALGRPRRAVLRRPLLTLLRVGFTEPPRSPWALVVSYTTVSPLPGAVRPPAVCFLWHFPAGHPGWALPTTLPCGARTFLDVHPVGVRAATARTTRLPYRPCYPAAAGGADARLPGVRAVRRGRVLRLYADDPRAAVAALRAGCGSPGGPPGPSDRRPRPAAD
jgi:hypothetical protein